MPNYYIGWDVGAWYCDNNSKSKDALVILNSSGKIIGKPWRGNLSQLIIAEECLKNFIERLFGLCNVAYQPALDDQFCMAIDTPLGFPVGFRKLLCEREIYKLSKLRSSYENDRNRHIHNPYLYRETERVIAKKFKGKGALDKNGNKTDIIPLSPIQHMIGAQATKGLHFLNQFQLKPDKLGVWKKDKLTVIEAYPATVLDSKKKLIEAFATKLELSQEKVDNLSPAKQDCFDAYKCAEVAKAFVEEKDSLIPPEGEIDMSEGWIWTFDIKTSE